MRYHRLPGDSMHHLRHGRFHSRAAAGGEDDGGETALAHCWLEQKWYQERRWCRTYTTKIVAKYSTTTKSLQGWSAFCWSLTSTVPSSIAFPICALRATRCCASAAPRHCR